MERPSLAVGIVMERRTVKSGRWDAERWEAVDVVPDPGGVPHVLIEDSAHARWLHPGFAVTLYRDEAEGYYLNLATSQPFVFVMWREEDGVAVPKIVTASYNEAGRMTDGGEQVDGVPMPADMARWLAEFTEAHYRPEPKKRIRPPSFKGARRTPGEEGGR
jgi:hypothetical protein